MAKNNSETSYLERVLNIWAIVLILWSLYRAQFKTELPLWIDELVAKPIIFLLPVYIFIKRFDKRKFFEAIDLRFVNVLRELALGISIGLIFFVALTFGNIARPGTALNALVDKITKMNILYLLMISLAASFSEEALSRGFVLKRLYEKSKNMISSSFFASILFFLLRIPILFTSETLGGFLLLKVMFIDLTLSFAISLIFLERKNLIAPIIIHAFYTLSLFLFV